MLDDLRASVRNLLRRPGYPAAAVAILAIGLTASTAVFTYVHGFDQPFPGAEAVGLMEVFGLGENGEFVELSYPDYLDLASLESPSFAGVAGDQSGFGASVRLPDRTEVTFGQAVTGDYFPLLGVRIHLGRGLVPGDDRADAPPVTVISYRYWQTRFHADPDVVGRTVYLNNHPYTMVGVTDRTFLGSSAELRPEIWLPIEQYKLVYWGRDDRETNRELAVVRPFVRRRDGVSPARAEAELAAFSAGLDADHPLARGPRHLRFAPANWIDPNARVAELGTLCLMLGSSAVLLLLTCANVANLLLSIASGRGREMALRAALGASPSRLLRQVLVETTLLAALAGGVALVLAGPASARLGSYFARPSVWGDNVARETSIDLRVFAFALAASIVTGLAAGLLPALRGARRNLVDRLRPNGGAGADGRRPWIREVLVSSQVALAVVLLLLAGLVLRTLGSVGRIDPGFDAEHLVASYMTTSSTEIPPEGRELFYRRLTERLAEKPWVRSAAVADRAPLSWHPTAEARVEGQDQPVSLTYAKVDPSYFDTLGLGILEGRGPAWTDSEETPGVAVVSETLARRFFPGTGPLGRKLWWPGEDGDAERGFEVVGVVRDAKVTDLFADDEPTVYFAAPQHYYRPGNAVILSTTIDPAAALPLFEQELRAVDSRLALLNALPYRDVVRGFTYSQRMNAELFSTIAFFGLVLAAIGIFSVLSLAVRRRRREIGVRMALGASRRAIASAVLARVLSAVGLGLAVGLAASFAAARAVESQLHGVEPGDPVALGAGLLVLLAAGAAASYLPVRRAVRADPSASLRSE